MSDDDHPLAAPAPAADEPLDALEAPAVTEERETKTEANGSNDSSSSSSAKTLTVKALADALLDAPPQPSARPPLPPPPPRPAPFLPSATGRPSSVTVLAATGPWARGEAAIVVTPAARAPRRRRREGGSEGEEGENRVSRTLLATVDPSTGRVLHDPARGVGTFASEAEALRALEDVWGGGGGGGGGGGDSDDGQAPSSSAPPPPFRVLARGCALLGYLRGGARTGAGRAVLLATGARLGAKLPGGHLARTVTGATWVSLPAPPRSENEDENNGNGNGSAGGDGDGDGDDDRDAALAEAAARFKLDGSHYYCETADVTRPFPGRRGIIKKKRSASSSPSSSVSENGNNRGDGDDDDGAPSWEFVWNAAVAAPLRAAGLGDAVPHLLQGVAESRTVALSREKKTKKKKTKSGGEDGAPGATTETTAATTATTTTTAAATLVLLTRASRLHAGTRYRARGLNALASPGNEVEVEQILWCDDDGDSDSDEDDDDDAADGERKNRRSNGATTSSSSSSSSPLSSSSSSSSPSISFSSAVWRRGTVPLWWGVEIRGGGVGEAAIVVAGHGGSGKAGEEGRGEQQRGEGQAPRQQRVPIDPYQGTRRYFRRLQRRFAWPEDGGEEEEQQRRGSGGGGDPSLLAPVHCVNLLRCSMSRHDELLLSEHFAEGIRRAKSGGKGGGKVRGSGAAAAGAAGPAKQQQQTSPPPPLLPLHCLNFDWHGVIKELGEAGAVDGLWASLAPVLAGIGLTSGRLVPASSSRRKKEKTKEGGSGGGKSNGNGNGAAPASCRWPGFEEVRLSSRQRGLLRYNCADSLDRTNAAAHFGGVLLLAEQCHALGLGALPPASPSSTAMAAVTEARGGVGGGGASQPQPPPPPLPPTVPLLELEPSLPAGWGAFLHLPSGRVGFLDHGRRETTWSAPPGVAAADVERAAAAAAAKAAAAAAPPPPPALPPLPSPQSLVPLPRAAALAEAGASSPLARRGLLLFPRPLLAALADAFRVAGDVHAHLYTASPAMHSGILGLLLVQSQSQAEPSNSAGWSGEGGDDGDVEGREKSGSDGEAGGGGAWGGASSASEDEGGAAAAPSAAPLSSSRGALLQDKKKKKKPWSKKAHPSSGSRSSALERAARAGVGRLRNATLSVQRRWANLTADAGRQEAIDAFLGLRGAPPPADAAGGPERLPPAYLCAGAEVFLEHDSDSDGGEEEQEEEQKQEREEAAAPAPVSPPPPPPSQQPIDDDGIEATRAALSSSSVGGGGEEELSEERLQEREREPLHPLDG